MATPILRTTLYIPPMRPGLMPCPGLIEWLNAGVNCRLTLISAPAGIDKTTLLSEWRIHRRRGYPAPTRCLVSLDESGNALVFPT